MFSLFCSGERVLCFHGPLIYEAKALRCQVTKDKQVKYFIHYAGWNKKYVKKQANQYALRNQYANSFYFTVNSWDEWVPENRVLKYNDANVQRQKEVSKLHASAGSAKNKKGAVAATGKCNEETNMLHTQYRICILYIGQSFLQT